MQIFHCHCGETVQAANEDDLTRRLKRHFEEDHGDSETGEDQVRELVTTRSYEATDS